SEDPVEYIHMSDRSLIHQREIGSDCPSFPEGLRQALRQDPDVVVIGEMRDPETISAAVTAAETGHLVLGTLHTQDAAQTVDRIIDAFPPFQQSQVRLQISGALAGICSQQLVPAVSGGRVAAAEFLTGTLAVKNAIREGKTAQIKSLLQTGASEGMRTMEQSLASFVREGRISEQAAFDSAFDPSELRRLLSSASRRSL
ncbi:MAG: ATPase, T2SS/T4P/T4SS family, partial [Pyramidobacter sp.]|nr:ATPase, T2SS/T4P/T4SS family [Pyramidobacter sp.]